MAHTNNAQSPIPMFTMEGVKNATVSHHPFSTEDGLGLHLFRFTRGKAKHPVLLLHGLTTSTDMYIMPEHTNLVNYLLDNGYSDVWSLDWRGSMRHIYNLNPNRYTLDDVALYDIPPAVDLIKKITNNKTGIHAIVHCVGSLSFFMSVLSGRIQGIKSIVSNSVSLVPQVHAWSKIKLATTPAIMDYVMRYPHLNPKWRELPGIAQGKIISALLDIGHRECDSSVCHMLSLMWGTGKPACFEHENLDPLTHDRLGDLFGAAPINYYRHIRRMVFKGGLRTAGTASAQKHGVSDNYLDHLSRLSMPVLFMTGDKNHIFEKSNVTAFEIMKARGADASLFIAEGYGHQDTLMGKRADKDVFPRLVKFMRSTEATNRR